MLRALLEKSDGGRRVEKRKVFVVGGGAAKREGSNEVMGGVRAEICGPRWLDGSRHRDRGGGPAQPPTKSRAFFCRAQAVSGHKTGSAWKPFDRGMAGAPRGDKHDVRSG